MGLLATRENNALCLHPLRFATVSVQYSTEPSLNVKQCHFVFKERREPIIVGGSFILSLQQGQLTLERAKKKKEKKTN